MRTVDAAIGKWKSILPALGVPQDLLVDRHQSCPLCGGKDRFRFDDKEGKGTYFCNQCGAGDGFKLAMEFTGMEFKDVAQKIDRISANTYAAPVEEKPKVDPRIKLKKIAAGLQRVSINDPVYKYLKSRGLSPTSRIRLHPSLSYWHQGELVGRFPAMVNVLTGPDNKNKTLHITYLDHQGRKAQVPNPKKMMTPCDDTKGAAVRLFNFISGDLAISEGVETALSVEKLINVPCWASLTANLLEKFQPPSDVRHLFIYADKDKSFTGQKSAYVLANKLAIKNIPCSVVMPPITGLDWNDILVGDQYAN